MLLEVTWRLNTTGKLKSFTNVASQKTYTDYGVCCRIFPQLDFDNPATKDIPASQYKSKKAFAMILPQPNQQPKTT